MSAKIDPRRHQALETLPLVIAVVGLVCVPDVLDSKVRKSTHLFLYHGRIFPGRLLVWPTVVSELLPEFFGHK